MIISKDIEFYDTSSLLLLGTSVIQEGKNFIVSSITIDDLKNIENFLDVKDTEYYNAELLLDFFDKYPEKYQIVTHEKSNERIIESKMVLPSIDDDIKVLSDALYYDRYIRPDEVIFVTHNLTLGNIANIFLGDQMIKIV